MVLKTIKNGNTVLEQFCESFDYETDLLVAGLGTAGANCLYTAIKNGINCIGVEKQSIIGGTGTAGCVQDYYYGQIAGIVTEINKQADNSCESTFCKSYAHPTEVSINASAKSFAFENASDKNYSILLDCVITGVITDNNKIIGVRAFYNNCFINIKAKFIADNTNGNVCFLAGCDSLSGRESDNLTMRVSKTVNYYENGKTHGEWCSLGYIDRLDEFTLSQKMLENEIKPPLLLEKYTDKKRAVFEGTLLGKREVKRVLTDYVITFDDLINFKNYDKPIFYGFASFDNVNDELENETENLVNWIEICYMRHYGLSFSVPLESLLPKGLDNILVIGKALGTTHDTSSLIRMKAEMEKCGEAAAYTVKLALDYDCDLREIDYSKLKKLLIKSGCLTPLEDGFFSLRKSENGEREKVIFPKSTQEIKLGLSSETPQFALFEILRTNGENIKEQLYEWIESDNKALKNNSAIALGLIKDKKAIAPLKEIINATPTVHNRFNGEHYFSWLQNDMWSDFIKAVILLGRFKDKALLNDLEVLKQKEYSEILKRLRVYQYIEKAIEQIKER